MSRVPALATLLLLSAGWLLLLRARGGHPKCQDLASYQAPYVASTYDRSRHLGHYYELAFRDLYPGSPIGDCQHTYKIANGDHTYYEAFEQKDMGLGRMSSVINLTETGEANGTVFNQSISWSNPAVPLPSMASIVFNTAVVAFKAVPGQQQYEWVLEFTCNRHDPWSLRALFEDGFVGINLYSRSGPRNASNLAEMLDAVKSLGLGWVVNNSFGWGFHEVPHRDCTYNPPSEPEYACIAGTCSPVRWGDGSHLLDCQASCSNSTETVI